MISSALGFTLLGLIVVVFALIYLYEKVIEPRRMQTKILAVLRESHQSISAAQIKAGVLSKNRLFGVSNNVFFKTLQRMVVSRKILTDPDQPNEITLRYYLPKKKISTDM